MIPPLKLGFLASRNGAGMRAIVQAIESGELDAEPRILISNRPGRAGARLRRGARAAQSRNTRHCPTRTSPMRRSRTR